MKTKLLTICLFLVSIFITSPSDAKEQTCAGSPIELKKGQKIYDGSSPSWTDCTAEFYSLSEGNIYKVIFKDGSPFYGIFEYSDGTVKKGQVAFFKIEDGKKGTGLHGQGTITYADGSKYVGEWKNNNYHGQGTYTDPDGNKYVGELKDNQPNGQGARTYANGNKYVGEWKNSKRHGQGTLFMTNGSKYVGEWKDNQPNGQGTETNADGSKYVGEWKNSKRHGQGTYTYANGKKQVAEWKDDKIYEYADDFDKYESEISRIKMTCADSNYGINTFSTDGTNLYYSQCKGCSMKELHVGHERAFSFSGRIQDLKKKDGENTYLIKYWQESLRGSNITFDVYVNFQKRKVIKHGVAWDCY
ncbi:hypothetical protein N9D82_02425 [Gammaproteobacteria bacterium]|nr:hypothetical protein [Gammaproteobacteria bacterium]